MIEQLPVEVQRHIVTTYCDGRTMSTVIFLLNKQQRRLYLEATKISIKIRLKRVRSITEPYLPALTPFLDQLIDRIEQYSNNDSDNQQQQNDNTITRNYSTWLSLLDYFEFGTIVSPTTLNRGSPVAELHQWPVWCNDINYYLHENAGEGILKKAIITTPCWHPSLLHCDSLTAATSSMLGPFPAPTGRAYLLQDLDFSIDDNTEMHNIMSNDDRGVIIVPVRVMPKQTASWMLVPPPETIIGEKHNLPFLFLQQGRVEWTPALVTELCETIVSLNVALLEVGFPLLRKSEECLVRNSQQPRGRSFLHAFLGNNSSNDNESIRGASMPCSQQ